MSPVHQIAYFFTDTATTDIYTLSLHELFRSRPSRSTSPATAGASRSKANPANGCRCTWPTIRSGALAATTPHLRSEEHTSELQSHSDLVCRHLLEKKKEN